MGWRGQGRARTAAGSTPLAILLACLAASVLFGLMGAPRLAAAVSSRGIFPLVVYAGRVPPAYAARRGPEVPLARPQRGEAGSGLSGRLGHGRPAAPVRGPP